MVGTVAGHGRDATAVAGPVRAALRAYAVDDPQPARVLSRLNRFLGATFRDDTYATAVVAHYRPATRQLTIANAAHPVPVLVLPGAAGSSVVPLTRTGPALGIAPVVSVPAHRLTLPPAAALCLYTDGLTDHDRDVAFGDSHRLADCLAAAGWQPTARGVLDEVIAAMLGDSPPEQDVCLAVLRGAC